MKKILNLYVVILCSIILFPFHSALALTATNANNCAGYSDVKVNDTYCQAIQYVTNQNIFNGSYSIETYVNGDKYFQPSTNINRAEVLKVILRAKGDATDYNKITTYGSEVGFTDISNNQKDWWIGYLKAAKNSGIIKGYADGTFRPVNPVSRAEFLKMLLEATPSASTVHNWTIQPQVELWADTPITAWYAKYIAFAEHYGLFGDFTACSWGNICPERPILRSEAAQMIYNYKKSFTDLGVKNTGSK